MSEAAYTSDEMMTVAAARMVRNGQAQFVRFIFRRLHHIAINPGKLNSIRTHRLVLTDSRAPLFRSCRHRCLRAEHRINKNARRCHGPGSALRA